MGKEFASVGPLSPGDSYIIEGGQRIAVKKEIRVNQKVNKLAREQNPAERASDTDPGLIGDELLIAPDEALLSALTEIGESESETQVTVWRFDPKRNIKVRLFGKPLDEFMALGLDGLAAEYGSGDYYIKVWRKSDGQVHTHRKVALEAPKGAFSPAAAPAADTFTAKDFIAMMAAQQAQTFTAMQGIAAAFAGRPQGGEGMTMKDVIPLLALFKEGKSEGGLGLKDVLALVSTAKDIIGDKSGNSNEYDLMKALVTQFAGPIAEVVKAKNAAPAANPKLPAPAGEETISGGDTAATQEDDPVLMLKLALKTLIESARTGADVETYANMVLDHAPSALQVKAYLSDEKWFDNLKAMNPGVEPYRAWFDKLRERTLQLIAEDETPAQGAAT